MDINYQQEKKKQQNVFFVCWLVFRKNSFFLYISRLLPIFFDCFEDTNLTRLFLGFLFLFVLFFSRYRNIVHFSGFVSRLLVSAWFLVRGFEKKMFTKTWMKLILRFIRYAQVPPIILIVAPFAFELLHI